MKAIAMCFLSVFAVAMPNFDSFPVVAVDGSGDAVAIWEAVSADASTIQAAMYQGGVWSASSTLSEANSFFAKVALNANGQILGIWQTHSNVDNFQVKSTFSTLGGAWQTPTTIPMQTGVNILPQIAIDQNGNGVAVWQNVSSEKTFGVLASSFIGGNWNSSSQLNARSRLLVSSSIDVNPTTGDAIVVWKQLVGFSMQIQTAFLSFGGEWSGATALSDGSTSAGNAQVALSSSGNAIVVWHQDSSDLRSVDIHAKVRFSDGTWGSSFIRTDENKKFFIPQVDINDQGLGLVVWLCTTTAGQSIEAVEYDSNAQAWGTVTALISDQTLLDTPQISMNHSGQAVAVWVSENQQGKKFIQAALRSSAGVWGAVETISDQTMQCLRPSVGMDSMGKAVVVWQQKEGSSFNKIETVGFSGVSWGAPEVIGNVE